MHGKLEIDRRLLLAGVGGTLAGAAMPAATYEENRMVETLGGKLRGVTIDGVTAYLGIPYAAPPVGALRFMPPSNHPPWSGVRDASRYGARAIQTRESGFSPEGMLRNAAAEDHRAPPLTHVPRDPRDAPLIPQSEDCLCLDVWSKAVAGERKPVLVWREPPAAEAAV